jgi:tetratricopeptide (TPR) repeat protein
MRPILLSLLLWFTTAALAAGGGAQPPSPEQLEKMNREMQQMLQDPAVRQQMDEALRRAQATQRLQGDAGGPPRATTAQGLPQRDGARIAKIARTPQTAGEMAAYLRLVSAAVAQRLPAPARAAGERLYRQLKASHPQGNAVASAASGAWIMGLPQLGLFLMGRAAADDPANVDHLNNYAAFLLMSGAEPQAVPILQNLKARFPQNTTVLNNLGQAWYGLGEIQQAEDNLDAAVRLLATHSQANRTKAEILEARGDTAGAAAAITASAQGGYSLAKARMAKRLGRPLPADVGSPPPRPPEDLMGLRRLVLPPFCGGVSDAMACHARWDDFHKLIGQRDAELQRKAQPFESDDAALQKLPAAAQLNAIVARDQMGAARPFALQAKRQADALQGRSRNQPVFGHPAWLALSQTTQARIDALGLGAKLKTIDTKYQSQWGEGKPNPYPAFCAERRAVYEDYLKDGNAIREQMAARLLEVNVPYFNEELHLASYQMSDRQFERHKLDLQRQYLAMLAGIEGLAGPATVGMGCPTQPEQQGGGKLQDFYAVHCDHIISLTIPQIGSWEVRCNRMSLNVNVSLGPVDLGIQRLDDLDSGRVVRGTVTVSSSESLTGGRAPGPIDVTANGSVHVEFDDGGVTAVGAEGGIQAGDTPVIGGEATYGWEASGATDLKGQLSGLVVP